MDLNAPATKQDVLEVQTRVASLETRMGNLETRMEAFETHITGALREMEERLTERMRDMRTETLRAFHTWARPSEMRLRTVDSLHERMGLLEDRVSELERRQAPT